MKRVAILGCTGSIGTQTLDVLMQMRDEFRVVGLGAGHRSARFAAQLNAWAPDAAALTAEPAAADLDVRVFVGPDALERLIQCVQPDIVVLGTPGLVGLRACLAALEAGKLVAVANKETLVSAGSLVKAAARRGGGAIVPVDSEHSGVWQCLRGEDPSSLRRIILTASGGALRDLPLSELAAATTEQVLRHPTWSMGPKITVDSATLMNKGLEIIEASWLFDVPVDAVDVVVHRQSIVHALVEFREGSVKAQLAIPDMRMPIVNALTYPERPQAQLPRLDIEHMGSLTFEPVDHLRYPALSLARAAAATGGLAPAVLNAANEVAVQRFLDHEISYGHIVSLVERVLNCHNGVLGSSLDELLMADAWAPRNLSLSGPAMSVQDLAIIPILVFLMVAHEFGHFITAIKSGIVVEEFALGFPPRLASFTRGGVRYSLNLLPLGAYVRMLGEEDPSEPGSFASKPKHTRAIVLAAGATMNFLVAILVFAIAYGTGAPEIQSYDIQISTVVDGSPAALAGMQDGDIIQSVDSQRVQTLDDFRNDIQQQAGATTAIGIERDGQPMTLSVMPRVNPPEGQGALGVAIRATNIQSAPTMHNPLESLSFGFQEATSIVRLTLAAPVMILQGQIAPADARPVGIVGMTQAAGQATAAAVQSGWWFPVLMLTGLISAGLAVANLLPIPALDGGRLLFVAIEAIRGRRVSPEREGMIHLVGMAFLLTIMVLVSYYDVVAPPPTINWGLH